MRVAAANLAGQQEKDNWNSWSYELQERGAHSLPSDWKNSMDRFHEAGLPPATLSDMVAPNRTVKSRNLFRYFAKIHGEWSVNCRRGRKPAWQLNRLGLPIARTNPLLSFRWTKQ